MATQSIFVTISSNSSIYADDFTIKDCFGNIIATNISRSSLILGQVFNIDVLCATVSLVSNTISCNNKTDLYISSNCTTWTYNNNFSAIDDYIIYYSCIDGSTQSIYVPGDDVNGVTGSFCNLNTYGNPTQQFGSGYTITNLGTNCVPTTTTTTTTTTSTTTTTTTSTAGMIYIENGSLNVPISAATVNGVSVTYSSGTDFTINAGNNGTFTTNQIGLYDIVVSYGGHIAGQSMIVNEECFNLNNNVGGTVTKQVDTNSAVYITVSDGSCF